MSTYIVVLNWNGAIDTCACIDSLLLLNFPKPKLIICDNGSNDNSLIVLRSHIDNLNKEQFKSDKVDELTPLKLIEIDNVDVFDNFSHHPNDIILIKNKYNLGFAGGCNVGLKYSISQHDMEYAWLLNNDTIVHEESLNAMLRRLKSDNRIGLVGSTLFYFNNKRVVQALGGGVLIHNKIVTHHIGEGLIWTSIPDDVLKQVESKMSYVVGASMLVTKDFLSKVGLLQEDYFLYYEEIDWAERARRCIPPYILAYAPDSHVYHKEGASAGTSKKTLFSLKYLYSSRLRFTKRFYASNLPRVKMHILFDGIKFLIKGRLRAFLLLLNICISRESS
jgi:GT2 family glycosyltransferase